jgi:hypothetical protein
MENPDYEKLYCDLIEALGYDPENVKLYELQEKTIEAAKILRRVAITLQTTQPEKSGALFICGIGGEKDRFGLPEYLDVCPMFGLQGVAVYKKYREYDEPGW